MLIQARAKLYKWTILVSASDIIDRLVLFVAYFSLLPSLGISQQQSFIASNILVTIFISIAGFVTSLPILSSSSPPTIAKLLSPLASLTLTITLGLIACISFRSAESYLSTALLVVPSAAKTTVLILRFTAKAKTLFWFSTIRALICCILFLVSVVPNITFQARAILLVSMLSIDLLISTSALFRSIYRGLAIHNLKTEFHEALKYYLQRSVLLVFLALFVNTLFGYAQLWLANIYLTGSDMLLTIFLLFKISSYLQLPFSYHQLGKYRSNVILGFKRLLFVGLLLLPTSSLLYLSFKLIQHNYFLTFPSIAQLIESGPLIFFILFLPFPRAFCAYYFDALIRGARFATLTSYYSASILLSILSTFVIYSFFSPSACPYVFIYVEATAYTILAFYLSRTYVTMPPSATDR